MCEWIVMWHSKWDTLTRWTLTKTFISNFPELLLYVSSSQNRTTLLYHHFTNFSGPNCLHVGVGDVCWVRRCSSLTASTQNWLKMQLFWQTWYMWRMAKLRQNQNCIPLSINYCAVSLWNKLLWGPLEGGWLWHSIQACGWLFKQYHDAGQSIPFCRLKSPKDVTLCSSSETVFVCFFCFFYAQLY